MEKTYCSFLSDQNGWEIHHVGFDHQPVLPRTCPLLPGVRAFLRLARGERSGRTRSRKSASSAALVHQNVKTSLKTQSRKKETKATKPHKYNPQNCRRVPLLQISPGQALWTDMFAEVGIFGSTCAPGEASCDKQFAAASAEGKLGDTTESLLLFSCSLLFLH